MYNSFIQERIWNGSPSSHFYSSPTRPSQPSQKMVMSLFFNLCSFCLTCFQVFLFRPKTRSCGYVVILIHIFFLFILTFVILMTKFLDVFFRKFLTFFLFSSCNFWRTTCLVRLFFSLTPFLKKLFYFFVTFGFFSLTFEGLDVW